MLIKILPTREQLAAWRRDPLGALWLNFAPRHFREMARLYRNGHFEYDPVTGEHRFGSAMSWNGAFTIGGVYAHNTRTVTGTNHILDVGIRNQSQTATWYFTPFSNDVTPATSWTPASWATETTNYDEATRQAAAWSAAASSAISTSAATTITASSGGMTVQGAALMSISTKSSTSGILLSAARITDDIVYSEAATCDFTYTTTIGS